MLSDKMPYNFDRVQSVTNRNWKDNLTLVPVTSKSVSQVARPLLACKMRDPITNIGLSLELLEATLTTPEQKKYIEIIRRNNVRINSFITLLLASQQEQEAIEKDVPIHIF